jgi:hypothetical protein
VFERFHKKKISIQTLLLWTVLWILLIIFAITPDSTAFLAKLFGIGTGLDLIIIFGIIGAYYLIFRLYLKLEKIDQNITELVRNVAIEFEEKDEDNEDLKK